MNSIKCKNCGLNNFSVESDCRRCGYSFIQPRRKTGKRPRRFSIWSLMMISAILGVVYYFYNGVQNSMAEIDSAEAKRVASQPELKPEQKGLSRSQSDQQRSGTYGNAVKNSPSLNAHQKHIQETEKAMQQAAR